MGTPDALNGPVRRPWHRLGGVVALLVLLGWAPPPAAAHAIVVASVPAANATVSGPDVDIRLQFNGRVDAKRSKLGLVAADGQVHPVEPVPVDSVDTVAGRATGLAGGAYRLQWQVLAVDGHITRGEIPFTVTVP